MAVGNVEKQREQVFTGPNRPSPTSAGLLNEERGSAIKADHAKLQASVKKANEAIKLCYNCETGFHYIEQ
ncbi:hypothetical protein [Desulfosporosinus sp.]|uniref:hypothetical protein n=1 Tax=Desulfosporosinus sp. TaxID=157907 RepID=UPI002320A929|nr:hypothetical protein [Desulfosporosinus sp.]MCO5385073.1 hypothetical protein [Desulfosporosinus sp.]MDA8220595.1 hypothetical protein [Desulfitobacterium hafniense]